jgi:ATP/maltotriose-dependent transcriptional regulator MalT
VWLAGFSLIAGEIEMLADDPVAAEGELRRGYAALEGMGDRGVLSRVAAELAQALFAQDRLDEAEGLTNVSEELAGRAHIASQISWRSVRARIHARRGELTTAEQLAREALALAERTDDINCQGRVLMVLAEVLETGGRREEATPLLGRALELFGQKENAVVAAKARALLEARVESPT